MQRTSANGTLLKSYDYDAFGVEKLEEPLDQNPFRYCGEYFDKETQTIYLRARSYDPTTSRMLSPDTHWNPSNMILEDSPVKINERKETH